MRLQRECHADNAWPLCCTSVVTEAAAVAPMNHLRELNSNRIDAPSVEPVARQPSARGASRDPRDRRARDRLRRRRRLVSAELEPFAAKRGIAGARWAKWTRRPRSTTPAIRWPSRSSRNSGSMCRSSRWAPHLVKALVAIEDQPLLRSPRLRRRPHRVGGAAERPAPAARVQGGSTITQQLARQSFLTPDKTFRRKLQEAHPRRRGSSARSRRTRSSSSISTRCTSATACTASKRPRAATSGSTPSELTSPEAALLAGLVKSPSSYAPTVSMRRARPRAGTSCCRRCSKPGSSIARTRDAARAASPGRSATACAPTSRTGSTSRSRCAASSSTGSAGSASTRAACACTRRST